MMTTLLQHLSHNISALGVSRRTYLSPTMRPVLRWGSKTSKSLCPHKANQETHPSRDDTPAGEGLPHREGAGPTRNREQPST